MRQHVNDLFQFSIVGTKAAVFTSVDMNKVAEAVINDPHLYFNEAKAEVIVGSLPTVLADESRMKQLLTNLVSNAIRFHDAAKPRVEVYASRGGKENVFVVRDNGIGIALQYQDKMLKMFLRLHTKEECPERGSGWQYVQRF